jgi:hypothetical protein
MPSEVIIYSYTIILYVMNLNDLCFYFILADKDTNYSYYVFKSSQKENISFFGGEGRE